MTQNTSASPLHDLARKHLPADVAERWIGLLRPAARLVAVPDPGPQDVVVGGSAGSRHCRRMRHGRCGKGTDRCRSSLPWTVPCCLPGPWT
ncbi:hypothetical protein ACFQ2B_39730 [Streptomyces stramineus]